MARMTIYGAECIAGWVYIIVLWFQMYLFNNIPANDFQNMMEDSIDTIGFGFGRMTVTHFRLASI